MTKIFSIELPVEQIKKTQTEKEDSVTEEKEVTMKMDDVSVKIKASPELLKKFIRGEKVKITVTQPQTQLPEGD
jgi:formate dehydrogenase assembly factor FdhD